MCIGIIATACSSSTSDTAVVRATTQAIQPSPLPDDHDCDEMQTPAPISAVLPTDLGADPIPGFQDSVSLSHFAFGDQITVETIGAPFPQTRSVGTTGTFVAFDNGFVLAAQRATSPALGAAPLFTVGSAHNHRVQMYFSERGLPNDQLGDVRITTHLYRAGTPTGQELARRLLGYTSTVGRIVALGGRDLPFHVQVADSRAVARFNINDEVVYEQVWWPPLPESIRSDIVAFQNLLQSEGYLSSLPPEVQGLEGALVVHHAEPVAATWYVRVTLDFTVENSTRSFDAAGTEVDFAKLAVPGAALQTGAINDPQRPQRVKANCKQRSAGK